MGCIIRNRGRADSPGWTRWLGQSDGSSTVEYALIVALVVVGGFLTVTAAGPSVASAFRSLAATKSVERVAATPDRAEAVLPNGANSNPTTAPAAFLPDNVIFWVDVFVGVLVLAAACGLLVNRRRDRKRMEALAEAETELPPELVQILSAKRRRILAHLSNNTQSLFATKWYVRHVMTAKVTSVRPRTKLAEVKEVLAQQTIRRLLVCDDQGQLAGIISDRDLAIRSGSTAADIMTASPATCTPDTPVATVISQLLNRRISCLPVCQEGQVVGLVTTTDLLMALQCALRVIESTTSFALGQEKSEAEIECTLQTLQAMTQSASPETSKPAMLSQGSGQ